MKGMTKLVGDMSGMMRDMGQMMGSGKMAPEEMRGMSKMMIDMSAMMKRVSEEGVGSGMEKATEARRTGGEKRLDRKDSARKDVDMPQSRRDLPRRDTDIQPDRRDFPRKDGDMPSDRKDSPRKDTDVPLEKKDSPVQ